MSVSISTRSFVFSIHSFGLTIVMKEAAELLLGNVANTCIGMLKDSLTINDDIRILFLFLVYFMDGWLTQTRCNCNVYTTGRR